MAREPHAPFCSDHSPAREPTV